MLKDIISRATTGQQKNNESDGKIKGRVVLMKKKLLDLNDLNASVVDRVDELLGKRVSLQLISAVNADSGKLGNLAYFEDWITTITPLTAEESVLKVTFDWDEEIGVPGAFIIRNNHHNEFFLKTLTLEDVPGEGRVHFVCNSWVYPAEKYTKDCVFFTNKTYLPSETPLPLHKYRDEELVHLRGDGKGELQEWDRVYDYAYYNDLGNPDKGPQHARRVLGGSSEFPYPRRGRTGRPPTKIDPNSESRLKLLMSLNVYVPRDERYGHVKMSGILGYALKFIARVIRSELEALFDGTPNRFDSFEEVLKLYEGGTQLPEGLLKLIRDSIPEEVLKEIFRTDGAKFLRLPMPQVIQEDKYAWRTDEEFSREMLAGENPVNIRRLQEFPPESKLDPKFYGDHTCTITEQHIKNNLDGQEVDEAIKNNKLFILDHHDAFMPYLKQINSTTTKAYASRTLLFLKSNGTLKPLAIELSLPHPDGDHFGCISKVYTPAEQGVENSLWQLAKAYAVVNDCTNHTLISHWLNTHAVIEPFAIATNRQLSVLHPVYKLLNRHFRDTMYTNAITRQALIYAGGNMEAAYFSAKYSMEISSVAHYKNWVFPEQALPADLIKRGVAEKDTSSPHGVRLLIEDYPYAVDGLHIWSAIRTWVADYCSLYYKTDDAVQKDAELRSWWKELVEEGHGDLKDEPWWPKMQTCEELIETCTIVIWTASALHAAVHFGQYAYGGYVPNRPTTSLRFMPEKGTPEYEELKSNPDKAFLRTFGSQLPNVMANSLLGRILAWHSSDEVYLGQTDTPEWTTDAAALEAFERFRKKLAEIEERITVMNSDEMLKNRNGPVKVPYTLLFPTSQTGLTGKGIPNSASV